MKTLIKTLACAAAVSALLLACDDTGTNNIEPGGSISNESPAPIMDSRVVSYQRDLARDDYIMQELGMQWYIPSFVTDKEILKLWFPHIFNDEQAESECNYFALHTASSSAGLSSSYEVLSQDAALYNIRCTKKNPPSEYADTGDNNDRAMLICDNKDWKLKESINLDSQQFIEDPDWDCDSGEGSPNWEDIYF